VTVSIHSNGWAEAVVHRGASAHLGRWATSHRRGSASRSHHSASTGMTRHVAVHRAVHWATLVRTRTRTHVWAGAGAHTRSLRRVWW
jgi:hypothetical protein